MRGLITPRTFDLTREPALVAMYLSAITIANLLVSWYGPAVAIINAFLFIGLDLVARDRLHEAWAGRSLWPRMLMLITAGGLLAYALGGDPRISLASCVSFIAAGVADALTYHHLHRRGYGWLARANGSNLAGAAVDSLVFPALAFGWPLLWPIVVGQFAAKVLGGAVWSVLLRTGRREEARKGGAR